MSRSRFLLGDYFSNGDNNKTTATTTTMICCVVNFVVQALICERTFSWVLYQLHVQRQALIASFISFMLQGEHCSLFLISYVYDGDHRLLKLTIISLTAIEGSLFYPLCDWRRSIIASFINHTTIRMEERHWYQHKDQHLASNYTVRPLSTCTPLRAL